MKKDSALEFLKQNSLATLAAESTHRLYYVKAHVPAMEKTLSMVVEVEAKLMDNPEVKAIMENEEQTDEAYVHVAAALVQLQLMRAGLSKQHVEAVKFLEIRRTDVQETEQLTQKYASMEGN